MVRPLVPGTRRLLPALIVFAVLSCGSANAGTVTLAWDPNTEADLAGYVVSWGTQPGAYTSSKDVGNLVTASVGDLAAGTRYYFAVQAYNTSGLTSAYSAEVSAQIPDGTPQAVTVTSITPTSGPAAGGTAVSVRGTGFASGAVLTFGGTPALAVTVLDATTITAVTPAHAAGAVDVVVTAGGRSSAPLAGAFSFLAPTLKVRDVKPRSGSGKGGQRIQITGDEFVTGALVTLGGVEATQVVVHNARSISAVVPAHARGPVAVAVRNPGGQTDSIVGFTYVDEDAPAVDTDEDGLPDAWEHRYGFDPNGAAGEDGPLGDADGDGETNLEELRAGTHPRGVFKRYFAEGNSGTFFSTELALANPSDDPVTVVLSFFTSEATLATLPLDLGPRARTTVDAHDVPAIEGLAFSTTVEASGAIVADRTMAWDPSGYGGHAETGIERPATQWFFAEGATHSGFDLFYLLQNPNDTAAQVQVRYLLPAGAPLVKQYTVPARSRYNIWVDLEDPTLALTDVSAVITSTGGVPIIAERSMYLYVADQPFGAGHNSAGITAPATKWFLAEGATGQFFDMFVLVANPTDDLAQVKATYLLPDGTTIEKHHEVGANSRFNIWVDYQDPLLADTAVSTTIESTNGVPLIVERTMWWPGGAGDWTEAHNAPGATSTSARWAVAQGSQAGARQTSTYVLLANTSAEAGDVRVTLLFEDGTTAVREVRVNGRSRFSVDVGLMFPEATDRRFGTVVEGLGSVPPELVVECATYWDAGGRRWAAGTDALATPLSAAAPPAQAGVAEAGPADAQPSSPR